MNLDKQVMETWRQPGPMASRGWGGARGADPEMSLNDRGNLKQRSERMENYRDAPHFMGAKGQELQTSSVRDLDS